MGIRLGQKYEYEYCKICGSYIKGKCILQDDIDENDSDIPKTFLEDKCNHFCVFCNGCDFCDDYDFSGWERCKKFEECITERLKPKRKEIKHCKYAMPVIEELSGRKLRICTKTNEECKNEKECEEKEERL